MIKKFNIEDYIGKKYHKLTVLRESTPKYNKKRGYKIRMVTCECECGNIKDARLDKLKDGRTVSCGCIKPKHGHTAITNHTPTYITWRSMKDRCVYRNFHYYKARGITVCDRWLSFTNFLEDMGERPEGKTLDRIDPNGNYEPNNCRWATPKEQRHNQRDSLLICPVCGYEIKNGNKFNMGQHIRYKHPNYECPNTICSSI